MRKSKNKNGKNKPLLRKVYDNFVANIRSLNIFVKHLSPEALKQDQAKLRSITSYFENIFKRAGINLKELRNESEGLADIKVSAMQKRKIVGGLTKYMIPRATIPYTGILFNSSLVTLISYLDYLISDLFHFYYYSYPNSLSTKEQSIMLNELVSCRDIQEAINLVISKEIEKIMYQGLEEKIRYLEKTLKIDCGSQFVKWNIINEAVERRNLIVHNNSIINKRYKKIIDSSIFNKNKKKPKIGQKIYVGEKYFKKVFGECFLAGIILLQNCWRKWKADEMGDADSYLIDTIFDLLCEEEWPLAEKIGLYAKNCVKVKTASNLILRVNYCQALKWQNKNAELETELRQFDLSAMSPEFLLAIAALKSDAHSFYLHLRDAISVKRISKDDLMLWPLFRELRKEKNFRRRVGAAYASVSRATQKHRKK